MAGRAWARATRRASLPPPRVRPRPRRSLAILESPLARLRLRPTRHVECHLIAPELPAGSAGSSLEPSCREPRWKLGSTVKIRGAQESLARLRLQPTRHARRPFVARASRAPCTCSSLVPTCRKPRLETWLNCEDPGRSRRLVADRRDPRATHQVSERLESGSDSPATCGCAHASFRGWCTMRPRVRIGANGKPVVVPGMALVAPVSLD